MPIQFLSTNTNLRTAARGGSIEKRAAFLLACVDAMAEVGGPALVAVKLPPGWTFHNVLDDHPIVTYSHVVRELSKRGVAYLQLSNYAVGWDVYGTLRPLFEGPVLVVAGFIRASGAKIVPEGRADMVAFGQDYIANPTLPNAIGGQQPNRPQIANYYTQGAEG